jgi:predicted nucleic acid-binding protein
MKSLTLSKRGTPIGGRGDGDYLIAAFCIVKDYTLVTGNTRHFERIDGLKYVNWKVSSAVHQR